MNKVLLDLSPTALTGAIEENLFEFLRIFRMWDGAEVHETPELLYAMTKVPFPLFNSIMRARIAAGRADAAVAEAVARGKAKGVPLLWWTGPSTRPEDLAETLAAHGFSHAADAPGMAADLASLPAGPDLPAGFTWQRVADEDALRICCHVMAVTFELPEVAEAAFFEMFKRQSLGRKPIVRHYLGRLNGEAVAASSLLPAAGVAGIYNVATLPAARGKGIGFRMTLLPLLEVRAEGCRAAILHSSEEGFGVYRKLGFRELCRIGQHVWLPGEA